MDTDDPRWWLDWCADELESAIEALIEHGCTDDTLKGLRKMVHNARNQAGPFAYSNSQFSREALGA